MSIISKTSIKQTSPRSHEVYVDGEGIHNVTYLNFTAVPCSVPQVDITINSGFEFDGLAKVSGILEIENLNSALRCIKFFCNLRDDVRKKFLKSISGAGKDPEDILDAILATEFSDDKCT